MEDLFLLASGRCGRSTNYRLSLKINMPKAVYRPIHPGKILLEEFLRPLKLSQYRLAKDISVVPRRINEIVKGKRSISADTALRLGRYFGNTPEFWLNLQNHYDLEKQSHKLRKRMHVEVRVFQKDGVVV